MLFLEYPLYLASSSPRRKKILAKIGLKFSTVSCSVKENHIEGEIPEDLVRRLSLKKLSAAESVLIAGKKADSGIILSADTVVVLDGNILGKPSSVKAAEDCLRNLSGRTHRVYTGIALKNLKTGIVISEFEMTEVRFRTLEEEEIKDYAASGSPMDKAGAYGIQDDFGAVFVSRINGCYYNVVGLPVARFYSALKRILQ